MRLRLCVVSLATLVTTCSFFAGCKEKPAATVKEVNALDAKSAEAPNPVEDPRFKDFFDHVRAYIKIHETADARVPSLKETSDPEQVSGREKALADEIRSRTRRRPAGRCVFAFRRQGDWRSSSPRISTGGRSGIRKPSSLRYR